MTETVVVGTQLDINNLPTLVWPRGAQRNSIGEVTLAGVSVTQLAAQFGTPLFVIDEADFRSRCQDMVRAFGSGEHVHYASKAFLSLDIARWVESEGLALDVCSVGELALALRAGFPVNRIALHGNNKSVAELTLAIEAGIAHIVIDSQVEISRLNTLAKTRNIVQDVLIRVTPGVQAHTHEFISTAHDDQKFGFSISDGAAMIAVREVLAAENLRLVGLHSHIGSQIFEIDGFELAAHRVLSLVKQIVDECGIEKSSQLTVLDLGGGLGISYVESDDPPLIDELAAKLVEIITKESMALGIPVPQLAVEPGRAIAGPGTVTLYEVGTTKAVSLDAGGSRRYISVDGGMSDNIRTSLYSAEYDVRLVNRVSAVPPVQSRVVGKHCESGDIVVRDCLLPGDVQPGDLLAVAATGAYHYSMSSRYNFATRPAVVAVKDAQARILLRRETIEDLLSLEVETTQLTKAEQIVATSKGKP